MPQMPPSRLNEIEGRILWMESLLDAIEDKEYESAIAAIKAYLGLLRKQRREALKP